MRLLEKTMILDTVEVSREELLILKNVLHEAYVDMGDWDFLTRIGLPPEDALVLLKDINKLLKKTI